MADTSGSMAEETQAGATPELEGETVTADHDEFALLHENADEAGLPWTGPPSVRRV